MRRLLIILVLLSFCKRTNANADTVNIPPLRVVYFIPSDVEPIPDRSERLGRVMRHVQHFFSKEMERNGYGPMTFALEWESPDRLKLYEVRGAKKQDEYGRNDAFVVRNEVRNALRSNYGINSDSEYLVIFQLLLKVEEDGVVSLELGPYVGSGTAFSGTAWVYDDYRLDSDLLSSVEPGGYYHRHVSLGQFNTHYIGGVAHELGHAFSLPHVLESTHQRSTLGTALMGSGNHTYGRELRGQGLGSFLHETSALRLSVIRAFAGNNVRGIRRSSWEIDELTAIEKLSENGEQTLAITGKISSASPNLLAIIAYNDNLNIPGDYDAKAWITKDIDDSGNFNIVINELEEAPYQLRLVGVHENGTTSQLSVNYAVDANTIQLENLNSVIVEARIRRLLLNENVEELKKIAEKSDNNSIINQMAQHSLNLLSQPKIIDVAALPASVNSADLTYVKFVVEQTGWRGVHRGRTPPDDVFIKVGGKFYESGLYAHAPSNYTVELGGKWKTLNIGFGLQDGYDGAVRFIIMGDDKELLNQEIAGRQTIFVDFSIENINKLELIVESTREGNSGAWGIWLNPNISR